MGLFDRVMLVAWGVEFVYNTATGRKGAQIIPGYLKRVLARFRGGRRHKFHRLQSGPSPHPAADDEINQWIQDLRVDIGVEDSEEEEDEVEVVEVPQRRILPPPPPPPPPPPVPPPTPPPVPVPERPSKRRRTSDSLLCLKMFVFTFVNSVLVLCWKNGVMAYQRFA
eukprot:s1345_g15.t1